MPTRVSRSQTGAVIPVTWAKPQPPPVLLRHWKLTPLPGVTTTSAKTALAAALSRNISPALAQALVLLTLVTRAGDLAIAAVAGVGVAELVGTVPDVCAARPYRVSAAGRIVGQRAGQGRRADVAAVAEEAEDVYRHADRTGGAQAEIWSTIVTVKL